MWKYLLFILLLPLTTYAQKADSLKRITKDTVIMQDVVVSTKVAVKVSGDTVSYNVDSLSKSPNATTEDVLKRLPGVEITPDGKIMANGKEITKIFINGKLYTSEDIRTLTQNLPAEVLEKMQLADWYDEESQFSGIKKGSTEKMLNLKIKKNYERGIYGQAIAGAGTQKTYQAGTFTNYMSNATRVTAILKMNNTGLSDVGITSSGNADNTRASTPNATGITTRRVADISFSNDNGGKMKLSGSYNAWYTNNSQQQSSLRNTYLTGDSALIQQQKRDINNTSLNHRLNIRSDLKIDSLQSLQSDIGLSYRKNDAVSTNNDGTYYNDKNNLSFTRNSAVKSLADGYGINISSTYRKRFHKPRRTLSTNMNIRYNKDDNAGDNKNTNQYYNPASININDFVSDEARHTIGTRVGASYNEPIGKLHTLSFSYNYNYNKNENDRSVWSVINDNRQVDTIQSREYDTYSNDHNINLSYQFHKEEKFRFNLQMEAQPFSRGILLSGYSNHIKLSQNGINYTPGLFTRIDINKNSNLNLHYNIGIRVPELTQLQVIPDFRDSLNIVLGNPNLAGEKRHNVSLNYNTSAKNNKSNFYANISTGWTYDKVVNNLEITASKRISTPTNADGYYNINGNAGYYKKIIKWLGASLSANGNQSNNIVITNNNKQIIPNQSAGGTMRIIFNGLDWYEGDVSYNYRVSKITNTAGITNSLQTQIINSSGTFTLPLQIRFIYFLNYIKNDGLLGNANPDFILVNATLEKTFSKPKGVCVRAQGFDVFNNYPNVQRSFGDNYFEDREANRLGRFFMLSLIYKFTYFPNKKDT